MNKNKNKQLKSQGVNDSETLRASWSDAAILTIGAICQQGSNVQLKGALSVVLR